MTDSHYSQEEARMEEIRERDDPTVSPPTSVEAGSISHDIANVNTAIVPIVPAAPPMAVENVDTTIVPIVPATPPMMVEKAAPKRVVPASVQQLGQRTGAWWANFRLWRLTRPFWGSILMLIASLLMLWGPISLLRFALLPGSSIWSGILVGTLLFVMALIQLMAPSYALITGAIGVVLSLVSLLVAGFGGLVIGVILGTIGSALGLAWRPNARPLPIKQAHQRKRVQSRRFIIR